MNDLCEKCANKDTEFCLICDSKYCFYMDYETKANLDRMCDLMCGEVEDNGD